MASLELMGHSIPTLLHANGSPEVPRSNCDSGITEKIMRFQEINLEKNTFLIKSV